VPLEQECRKPGVTETRSRAGENLHLHAWLRGKAPATPLHEEGPDYAVCARAVCQPRTRCTIACATT
jgi:hypothetical protein